jgi:HAD superfamily hydrolase (TIGR01509 family)
MTKLIIFDLDGVLVDTKMIHYYSLNMALQTFDYPSIGLNEHLARFDGKSTKDKLKTLVNEDRINPELVQEIEEEKKGFTRIALDNNIVYNQNLVNLFYTLKENGFKIAVASNAIRETVVICLLNLGVMRYVDYFQSNEDVQYKKPHPQMYWNCMTMFGAYPKDTYIVEDSAVGRQGALASGANLIAVNNHTEVTEENIMSKIQRVDENKVSEKWEDDDMVVLIPMAGAGSRFADAGYTFPKPLIEVKNKPMIQVVVDNLGIKAKYVYIVQKAHYEKYNLQHLLNLITPNCEIVQVEGLTEGAACTTLLAKEFINNDKRLVIANSDQFVEWNSNEVMYSLVESSLDGGILTFKSTHPKWSFAKVDENGFVVEVAEKKPISDNATVGVYYWKKGSDYVKYAEKMIEKNIRVNNEFYVAPVFNQAIDDGKRFGIREISAMWGIGTPEDLNYFLANYKGTV